MAVIHSSLFGRAKFVSQEEDSKNKLSEVLPISDRISKYCEFYGINSDLIETGALEDEIVLKDVLELDKTGSVVALGANTDYNVSVKHKESADLTGTREHTGPESDSDTPFEIIHLDSSNNLIAKKYTNTDSIHVWPTIKFGCPQAVPIIRLVHLYMAYVALLHSLELERLPQILRNYWAVVGNDKLLEVLNSALEAVSIDSKVESEVATIKVDTADSMNDPVLRALNNFQIDESNPMISGNKHADHSELLLLPVDDLSLISGDAAYNFLGIKKPSLRFSVFKKIGTDFFNGLVSYSESSNTIEPDTKSKDPTESVDTIEPDMKSKVSTEFVDTIEPDVKSKVSTESSNTIEPDTKSKDTTEFVDTIEPDVKSKNSTIEHEVEHNSTEQPVEYESKSEKEKHDDSKHEKEYVEEVNDSKRTMDALGIQDEPFQPNPSGDTEQVEAESEVMVHTDSTATSAVSPQAEVEHVFFVNASSPVRSPTKDAKVQNDAGLESSASVAEEDLAEGKATTETLQEEPASKDATADSSVVASTLQDQHGVTNKGIDSTDALGKQQQSEMLGIDSELASSTKSGEEEKEEEEPNKEQHLDDNSILDETKKLENTQVENSQKVLAATNDLVPESSEIADNVAEPSLEPNAEPLTELEAIDIGSSSEEDDSDDYEIAVEYGHRNDNVTNANSGLKMPILPASPASSIDSPEETVVIHSTESPGQTPTNASEKRSGRRADRKHVSDSIPNHSTKLTRSQAKKLRQQKIQQLLNSTGDDSDFEIIEVVKPNPAPVTNSKRSGQKASLGKISKRSRKNLEKATENKTKSGRKRGRPPKSALKPRESLVKRNLELLGKVRRSFSKPVKLLESDIVKSLDKKNKANTTRILEQGKTLKDEASKDKMAAEVADSTDEFELIDSKQQQESFKIKSEPLKVVKAQQASLKKRKNESQLFVPKRRKTHKVNQKQAIVEEQNTELIDLSDESLVSDEDEQESSDFEVLSASSNPVSRTKKYGGAENRTARRWNSPKSVKIEKDHTSKKTTASAKIQSLKALRSKNLFKPKKAKKAVEQEVIDFFETSDDSDSDSESNSNTFTLSQMNARKLSKIDRYGNAEQEEEQEQEQEQERDHTLMISSSSEDEYVCETDVKSFPRARRVLRSKANDLNKDGGSSSGSKMYGYNGKKTAKNDEIYRILSISNVPLKEKVKHIYREFSDYYD